MSGNLGVADSLLMRAFRGVLLAFVVASTGMDPCAGRTQETPGISPSQQKTVDSLKNNISPLRQRGDSEKDSSDKLPSIPLSQRGKSFSQPDGTNLAALLRQADRRALHEHPQWLALLHYEREIFPPGMRSPALTSSFFLAKDGDRNPRAELHATLRSFFVADMVVRNDEHPQCAFIARRHWLEEQLGAGAELFPKVECGDYERWCDGLDVRGLTLIFPEGFLNNPASIFGHTLLRIDASPEGVADELLGYAVDFTANTQGDSVLRYIFKGILGFYPALFGVHPYYEQLKHYADWENRNIWEYRLNVNDDELDFLLMHLWELQGIRFPYYFFTKNCSYELLRLLDIGVPDLQASRQFQGPVIPVDTVKVIVEKPGFVRDVRYRASPAAKLRATLRSLSPLERQYVRDVVEGRLDPADATLQNLPPWQRASILDAAYDQLRYQYLAKQISEEASRNLSRRILIARSRVGKLDPGEEPGVGKIQMPDIRPDQGHDSMRASVTLGWRDDETFLDVQFRPALHSFLDDGGGYPEQMQLSFLDTRMRIYPESGQVRLQQLTLIDIASLSPRSRVFKPWAWRFETGLRTHRVPDGHGLDDASVWDSQVGAGVAWDPLPGLLLYGLADARLDVGPDLDDNVSFGPGVRFGTFFGRGDSRWKGHIFSEAVRFLAGETTTQLRGGPEVRFSISRNTALILHGSVNRIHGESWLEGNVRLDQHF